MDRRSFIRGVIAASTSAGMPGIANAAKVVSGEAVTSVLSDNQLDGINLMLRNCVLGIQKIADGKNIYEDYLNHLEGMFVDGQLQISDDTNPLQSPHVFQDFITTVNGTNESADFLRKLGRNGIEFDDILEHREALTAKAKSGYLERVEEAGGADSLFDFSNLVEKISAKLLDVLEDKKIRSMPVAQMADMLESSAREMIEATIRKGAWAHPKFRKAVLARDHKELEIFTRKYDDILPEDFKAEVKQEVKKQEELKQKPWKISLAKEPEKTIENMIDPESTLNKYYLKIRLDPSEKITNTIAQLDEAEAVIKEIVAETSEPNLEFLNIASNERWVCFKNRSTCEAIDRHLTIDTVEQQRGL